MAHGAVAGMVYFGVTHLPRIEYRIVPERYSIRQLDVPAIGSSEPEGTTPSPSGSDSYPDVETRSAVGVPPELREAMSSFLENADRRQTPIQPEIQSRLNFVEWILLPSVVMWAPQQTWDRTIVAPPPAPETAAHVTHSLELPDEEIRLADLGVASEKLARRIIEPAAVTTSPLQLPWAKPVEMVPVTTYNSAEQPAPATVLASFDVFMKVGKVPLPTMNGAGFAATLHPIVATRKETETPSGSRRGRQIDSNAGPAPSEAEAADNSHLTTEHIVLPKNGRFGVVVVGDAVGEDYPEALAILSSRVAYTAYLPVGLTRNWILQYSMLRSDEAAVSGSVTRLEAPWPYEIFRPNLTPRDLNTDALMIHGILTSTGRLESLAIAFPSRFRYASFVLHALRQWQFRPARRNGQATPVEVLLIIPEQVE